MKITPFEVKSSPFDPLNVPPATADDLMREGIKVGGDEQTVQLQTRVPPSVVLLIDRIIERRVLAIKSRQDFIRLAVLNLLQRLEHEIQSEQLQTIYNRIEFAHQNYAQLLAFNRVLESVLTTMRTVRGLLAYGNRIEAIKRLQNAKRIAEEIPFEGLRAYYINMFYGSPDGKDKPVNWQENEAAVLWDQVLSGKLDYDDTDEVEERIKLR